MAGVRRGSSVGLLFLAIFLAAFGATMLFGPDGEETPADASGDRVRDDVAVWAPTTEPEAPADTESTSDPDPTTDPDGTQEPDSDGDDPSTDEPTDPPTAQPDLPPGVVRPGAPPPPDPATVDGTDATAVARAVMEAIYTVDTEADESAEDAVRSAEAWLAESYDASAYDLADFEDDARSIWFDWSEHGAYMGINAISEQIASDMDTPEERGDTETHALRQFEVNFTPLGRDGWNGVRYVDRWYIGLGRESAADDWQVVELRRPML